MAIQRRRWPDTRQHQQLRRVECTACQDHLAPGMDRAHLARSVSVLRVRAIQPFALLVLDADGTIIRIEQHPRRQCIQLDPQAVTMARRDIQQPLARSSAPVTISGKRREAQSVAIAMQQPLIVRIEAKPQESSEGTRQARRPAQDRMRGIGQRFQQPPILEHLPGHRAFGGQPAVPTMTGPIEPKPRQHPPYRPIPAFLEFPEIAAHALRLP